MTALIEFDQSLFFFINNDCQNAFLDWIMPMWRNKVFWVPAYLALTVFLFWKYKTNALVLVLGMALTIGIADTMSSRVIKKSVKRLRPCREQVISEDVHLLVHCGGGYSFTSSHATNHFALAMFLIGSLGLVYRRIKWPLLAWAASIALGQVYVGVHYPLDICCGAILGSLIGWGVAKVMYKNKWLDFLQRNDV